MDLLMAKLTANSKLCLIRSAKDAVIRYDKICRTCLGTNNVVSIFNVTYENSNFSDLLQQHVSIHVQEHDALPTQICDNCIAELIHLHTFKKKCLQTQVTLDEIIKYHEALNQGTGIQSCNLIQVPFIFQEVLTCQGNNQNEEKLRENNQNEKFKGNNQNKEKVQKINSTKVVKNNNHGNDQSIRSKQSNSKVNSAKAISINDNTNVLQMEVIIGDDDTFFILEDADDEDWSQKVVLEKGNNNIAETEDKIIISEINSEEVLENINNIKEQKTASKQEIEVQKEKKKLLSKLVCNVCKEKFDTVDELKQHRKDTNHHIVRRSTCHVCGKMVGGHLSSHLRTHTLEKPYKCHICHKAFGVGNNLQRHMKIHTGEKHFICEICGKGYARQDTLKEHKVIHTGEFPFTCDYCGKTFNHMLKLRFHLRRHEIKSGLINKMSKEEKRKLTCEVCHKIYSSRAILYTHKFVHGEKMFVCDECGKKFHTRMLLRSHQRVHTGEKPYSCKVCGKSLATQTSLKTHILIHTGEKPHSCKNCSRSFKQITHLKHHMRTHSGEKPYKCDFCGKCFALKGNLTIHIRTHTGETPFVCEICDRGFHDSGSLKKHKRTHSDC